MEIFNNEMYAADRRVPLEGIELSGYGASMFSHWYNEHANVASVSQAHFDVLVGRTSREVVQVRSILYPFAVHVVRTITLTRAANGYVYRSDSGWKAESDGNSRFQLLDRIRTQGRAGRAEPVRHPSQPINFISNVREIRDIPDGRPYTTSLSLSSSRNRCLNLCVRRCRRSFCPARSRSSCSPWSSMPTCISTTWLAARRGPGHRRPRSCSRAA